MGLERWWHVAVVATAVVLSALALLEGVATWRFVGILIVHAIFVLVWFTLGRRAMTTERLVVPTAAAIILLAGVDTGFDSAMATIQCIGFPMIWVLAENRRIAIGSNIALAAAVGIGMFVSSGHNSEALVISITIESLSLAFSIALGLWITSIATQSDERQRLLDELEAAQSRLAVLSRDAGVSSERERLAREIHDTIAQDLAGLVLTAQRGMRELKAGNTDEADTQLQILEENARHALAETRALVASGAAVGADGGLATALRRLGERFERETGIAVTVTADDATTLDRDAEVVLLRCAQEALANVRKHSAAATASLTLVSRGEEIDLTITDDGRGFDPADGPRGFGLDGMRERLAFVHGSLAVESLRGAGTTLVATLPTPQGVTA